LLSRFSPAWARGDAPTFARIVGNSLASPVRRDDPRHAERLERYERNIAYYTQAQYWQTNQTALETQSFTDLRVNYTGIAQRSAEMKADWLFAEPLNINAIANDSNGESDPDNEGPNSAAKKAVDRINQVRKYNQSQLWDWVMAVMGIVCGDFFLRVDAVADDQHPLVEVLDPSFVFPDYPDRQDLPMRSCQIQYQVDPESDDLVEDPEVGGSVTVTEDYRLELVGASSTDDFEELDENFVTDEELLEAQNDVSKGRSPKLTCIYRMFRDDFIVPGSKRDIGIPAIPIVHGVNSINLANRRYGADEIERLIAKIEKYNELYYYVERVARHNSHSKLAITGVRPADGIQADYDDVIYLGKDGNASVLTLPSDMGPYESVTKALDRELHLDAYVPQIGEGDTSGLEAAPSGLSLKIRYGPLRSVTKRHTVTYGSALEHAYTLVLLFDEMVIQGEAYGSVYKYDTWSFNFGWTNQMPQSDTEDISNMRTAVGDGVPLISARTARERIPGVNPDQEETRLQRQTADAGQQSLSAPTSPPNGLNRLLSPPDNVELSDLG
jgi:hypothetical protein